MSKRVPKYAKHSSGQARVRINGKTVYLGVYGSSESKRRYSQLIAEWCDPEAVRASSDSMTVNDVALLYMEHAARYYQKNGEPTCEVNNIRIALRPLVRLFGTEGIRSFGPKKLKVVRQAMIEAGCVRTSINRQVGRIKRMVRWAVENEYVLPDVYTALTTVAGLRCGRSDAKESDPVSPVSQHAIDATRPHVSRHVWAMVELQLLSGMRPGEVIAMRGSDLNMSGRIWEYTPVAHKTEHHGRRRVIFFGPKAQPVIREFLSTNLNDYLFSPRRSREEFDRNRTTARKTPFTPSQRKRKRVPKPKRKPGERYTVCSYRQSVVKACEKAFDMPSELQKISTKLPDSERDALKEQAAMWRKEHCWHPNQLRHNVGTEIRREFGIEATRTVLGHASTVTSEVYAEKDLDTARDIIAKIG